MLSHSVRPNVFAPERTWTLEPDALAWSDTRRRGRVPYGDVTAIRLVRTPWPPTSDFAQATVDTLSAGRIVISGTHYLGLGRAEDRRSTYAPLIRDLVRRVAAANPAVRLMAGHGRLQRLLWMVIAVIGAVALATALLGFVLGEADSGALPPIIAIAVAAPMAWQVIRGGKPRRFTPDAIPEELLQGPRPR